MNSRPTPRRSSLAGASPVAPPTQPEPVVAVESAPAAAPRTARAASSKVSFYQQPQESARMRAAMMHTQLQTGVRGLSDFIARACLAEVERLEREYNAGNQWEPIGPGQIPTGRPMGE